MKKWIIGVCMGLLALFTAFNGKAQSSSLEQELDDLKKRVSEIENRSDKPLSDDTFRVYWKEGIRLDSKDKAFKLKLGGRIMNDWAWLSGDEKLEAEFGDLVDGTEFRRARLYVEGTIYDNAEFKAQYDFAGGNADMKDMYVGLKHLPVIGSIRVGHQYEPFGLEEMTSSKYITFVERGLTSAFVPSRQTGIKIFNHLLDERITWAVGGFRSVNDYGDGSSEAEYNVTARVTGLPLYLDDGKMLIHLGAAYSRRSPTDDALRFRERPETHLAPRFVDTGHFAAESENLYGAEAAAVFGPFSVQGEYMQANVDAGDEAEFDPSLSAYYVMGSVFLTGELRKYKKSEGLFDRVKPKKNFLSKDGFGPGAIELAARYSNLDLNDHQDEEDGIAGGELDDITVGLNWYLNPNTRIMANYVRADLDEVGNADIFQTRFQVDF
jgi:phosphate-selective porin OprO/OprP